jgi:hypothetical protein
MTLARDPTKLLTLRFQRSEIYYSYSQTSEPLKQTYSKKGMKAFGDRDYLYLVDLMELMTEAEIASETFLIINQD